MRSGGVAARLAPVLALLVLLTGCGDSPDAQPEQQPTSTVTVTETAKAAPETSTPSSTETAAPTTPGAPTSYADALARLSTGEQTLRVLGAWQSPTGNIHCLLDDNGFDGSCEILDGRIEPQDSAVCDFGEGERTVGRIEIHQGSVTPVCNTDTIMNPDAPVLEYGAVTRSDGFISCLSEERGMTCVNTDIRKGFFLARGSYEIFGE